MATVSTRQILIVDDNVDLAENIAEILQLDGHRTDVASSAEEALLKAVEGEPDVVVTDYRLPGINGVLFVRELRRARPHVQAIVISAYTDDGTMKEATDAEATFMAKPLDFKLLCRVVRGGLA